MTEIKINSRPCPSCGHRNITSNRSCERCGRTLGMSQNLKLTLMGIGVMAVVAIGGLYAVDAFTPTVDNAIAPVYTPQSPQEQVKEIPSESKKPSPKEVYTDNSSSSESVAQFVAERPAFSANYRNYTQGARQIFESIEVRISNAPINDVRQEGLEKLASELESGQYFGQTIYLLSFAETVGTIFVAEERAKFAKRILIEKHGVTNPIEIQGFGPDDDLKVKPQRIEVWVK